VSELDARLFRVVNRLSVRTPWAHGLLTAYAKDGIVLFAVLLVVAWLAARREADVRAGARVISTGVATLLALGAAQLIGNAVDRARPYDAMPHVLLLVARTGDFSFPSDHATAVGAVAAGLLLTRRRLGTVAAVLALVMAFARVYVGTHYPGDVVAGLALGGATAAAVLPLAERLLAPALVRLRSTPLARIGP
jgi:membrane-associated phospholipid phosphatase